MKHAKKISKKGIFLIYIAIIIPRRIYMTQKELLYLEDAIGHEDNIIKICSESLKNMQDNQLISFIENEINLHQTRKQKLISTLEEKNNG